MKETFALAAAIAFLPAFASAGDVLQARWLKATVNQLAPESTATPQKPAQSQGAQTAQQVGAPEAFKGRDLSHILRERKMPIKKVWRERKAKSVPGAPQKKSQAPRAS